MHSGCYWNKTGTTKHTFSQLKTLPALSLPSPALSFISRGWTQITEYRLHFSLRLHLSLSCPQLILVLFLKLLLFFFFFFVFLFVLSHSWVAQMAEFVFCVICCWKWQQTVLHGNNKYLSRKEGIFSMGIIVAWELNQLFHLQRLTCTKEQT